MKGRGLLAVGLAVVVGFGGLAVLAVGGPAVLYKAQAQITDKMLPDEVVTEFYEWYRGTIDLEAGQNPLVDRSYRSSEHLSESLVAEVDDLLDSLERGGYDPFLLAQDVPGSIEVGDPIVSGETAFVRVETSFAGHALMVSLKHMDGAWKIDNVSLAPEMVVESFYGRYLAYVGADGEERRNPLVDGFYRDCPELSETFVAQVDETLDSFDRGGFDPILMAQDVPVSIDVGEAGLEGDEARVKVEMFWGGNPEPSEREVILRRIEGRWQIVDVTSG